MHDYYWQNYTEMDQYGYEDYDNQQALLHQVNANQEQLLLRSRFRKMLDSPFFGRVDFCYDGDDEPEIFYIGIDNFAERPGELPLIYDWRSPVSGLFYDFDRGPASYLAPGGEMTGEICSKWQYKIRDGKMIYGFESDVKIDDDILKAELGSNGEVQLKNIIRTIQKEQNAIIRNTKDRILVIQGAAGSGKTSVALHRIAYLLYHDRQNLKSSNILILSPNGVFSDYISHILPELGEENIQEMSFDLFAYRKLQDTAADCEDRCDQIEREMRDPKAAERFALKQSQAFVDQMEGFALELEDELMNFSDVSYKSFVKSESEIITLFYDKFADIPLLSRMDAVAETFIDEIETLLNRDLPEEERIPLIEKFRKMYETMDFYVLYNRFLKKEGYQTLPRRPLEKRKLRYEDVYPVLYLKYRLSRQAERSNIKHLVIDEMQDYFEVNFPQDYRSFLKQNNGAVPLECQFDYNGHSYAVERFLCMLPNELLNEFVEGCYDIGVVETQLDDRLGDDGDETGTFIIPIAVLFAGDFVCLDFRKDKENPEVCIWYHEMSEYLAPYTKRIAGSFTEFLSMLYE